MCGIWRVAMPLLGVGATICCLVALEQADAFGACGDAAAAGGIQAINDAVSLMALLSVANALIAISTCISALLRF